MAAKLMRHLVFDGLRDDIMSCHFSPGRELRENELAQKYGKDFVDLMEDS